MASVESSVLPTFSCCSRGQSNIAHAEYSMRLTCAVVMPCGVVVKFKCV